MRQLPDAPPPARSPPDEAMWKPADYLTPPAAPESVALLRWLSPDTPGTGDWDRNRQDRDPDNHISDSHPLRCLPSKLPQLQGALGLGMSRGSEAAARSVSRRPDAVQRIAPWPVAPEVRWPKVAWSLRDAAPRAVQRSVTP
jgi:hypothetical protein